MRIALHFFRFSPLSPRWRLVCEGLSHDDCLWFEVRRGCSRVCGAQNRRAGRTANPCAKEGLIISSTLALLSKCTTHISSSTTWSTCADACDGSKKCLCYLESMGSQPQTSAVSRTQLVAVNALRNQGPENADLWSYGGAFGHDRRGEADRGRARVEADPGCEA
jgi:hypothetical protein